jgi:hypothetical protein
VTFASDSPARSGRPPRDTTEYTRVECRAAVTSAAAAPVLAPNSPIGRSFNVGCSDAHRTTADNRSASMAMSNRISRV